MPRTSQIAVIDHGLLHWYVLLLSVVVVTFTRPSLRDTQDRTITTHRSVSVMASFMVLPGELRNKIYDLCLYRVIIYPHGRAHKTGLSVLSHHPHLQQLRYTDTAGLSSKEVDEDPPNLAILGVSRQIRREALAVYLGRNIVVLPSSELNLGSDPNMVSFQLRGSALWTLLLAPQRIPYFKTVKIDFSMYNFNPNLHTATTTLTHNFFNSNGGFNRFTPLQRRDRAHKDGIRILIDLWMCMLRSVWRLGLDELIIDLTWCYCMNGCCRIVNQLRSPFIFIVTPRPRPRLRPKLVTILGSLTKYERDSVKALLV